MKNLLVNQFPKLERHPRNAAIANVLLNLLFGGVIGVAAASAVLGFSALLDQPWNYLTTAAILLLAKTAWRWVTTLWLGPFASNVAATIFERQTGIEVPEHAQRPNWGEHSVSIITLGATIAIAGYLNSLGSGTGNATEMLGNGAILGITSCAGAVTAASQNLSGRVAINALWRNKHDYQNSTAYQQGQRHAQGPARGKPTNNRANSRGRHGQMVGPRRR